MFSYCGNNPVVRVDNNGQFWFAALVVGGIILGGALLLSGCSKKSSSSKATTTSPRASTTSPRASTTSPNTTTTSPSIPPGGKKVYRGSIRICTDGSDGTKVPDNNWQKDTAYYHKGKPIDAYSVPYVVKPINDESIALGDSALLINHVTGKSVWCVVGEVGKSENGWGEVSICAIWDAGNPEHMTANSNEELGTDYEIILYPDVPYNWGD